MKLPMRKKSPVPAALLFQAEEKGPGGTSPTQRAYRSHTSDLITRLDRLLAPKRSGATKNKKMDAQGASKAAGPPKSRARNIVLRDLVDILTKIWRDETSLEMIAKKRDEVVPSPPPVGDDILPAEPKSDGGNAVEQKLVPKVAIKTEAQTIRSTLMGAEEASFETDQMSLELLIPACNTEVAESWISAENLQPTSVLPSGPALSGRSDDAEIVSWLEEQPVGVKREESTCTSPDSDHDLDCQGFMLDVPQSPPESPFEEPVTLSKGGEFGFGWNTLVDDAPLMVW